MRVRRPPTALSPAVEAHGERPKSGRFRTSVDAPDPSDAGSRPRPEPAGVRARRPSRATPHGWRQPVAGGGSQDATTAAAGAQRSSSTWSAAVSAALAGRASSMEGNIPREVIKEVIPTGAPCRSQPGRSVSGSPEALLYLDDFRSDAVCRSVEVAQNVTQGSPRGWLEVSRDLRGQPTRESRSFPDRRSRRATTIGEPVVSVALRAERQACPTSGAPGTHLRDQRGLRMPPNASSFSRSRTAFCDGQGLPRRCSGTWRCVRRLLTSVAGVNAARGRRPQPGRTAASRDRASPPKWGVASPPVP